MGKIAEGILGAIVIAVVLWWVYSTANPTPPHPQQDAHWKCVGTCTYGDEK